MSAAPADLSGRLQERSLVRFGRRFYAVRRFSETGREHVQRVVQEEFDRVHPGASDGSQSPWTSPTSRIVDNIASYDSIADVPPRGASDAGAVYMRVDDELHPPTQPDSPPVTPVHRIARPAARFTPLGDVPDNILATPLGQLSPVTPRFSAVAPLNDDDAADDIPGAPGELCCSVCMFPYTKEIYAMPCGHSVCHRCKPRLEQLKSGCYARCSKPSGPMTFVRNIAAEAMAQFFLVPPADFTPGDVQATSVEFVKKRDAFISNMKKDLAKLMSPGEHITIPITAAPPAVLAEAASWARKNQWEVHFDGDNVVISFPEDYAKKILEKANILPASKRKRAQC